MMSENPQDDRSAPQEIAASNTPDAPAASERRLRVVVVTGERMVYDGPADTVVLPGAAGQISVRRNHAALIAQLLAGEIIIKDGSHESVYVLTGGFVEVGDNRATVLADSVQRSDEIDLAAAERVREQARHLLRGSWTQPGYPAAEEALRLSKAQIAAVVRSRRRERRQLP